MNDPASTRASVHPSPEIEAVETIGAVITDLVEVAERLPVRAEQAEPTARILERLSEELGEAAGMLRAISDDQPVSADRELARLKAAFPPWRIAWVGGPDWTGFTASREGFPRANATTAAGLAARIFHYEGSQQ